jgi:hypothetical protein
MTTKKLTERQTGNTFEVAQDTLPKRTSIRSSLSQLQRVIMRFFFKKSQMFYQSTFLNTQGGKSSRSLEYKRCKQAGHQNILHRTQTP